MFVFGMYRWVLELKEARDTVSLEMLKQKPK